MRKVNPAAVCRLDPLVCSAAIEMEESFRCRGIGFRAMSFTATNATLFTCPACMNWFNPPDSQKK